MKKLNLYCTKILPLVYDESLSYYEAICKTNAKINEIIDVVDDNLETYVRQILNNLLVNVMYNADDESISLVFELGE